MKQLKKIILASTLFIVGAWSYHPSTLLAEEKVAEKKVAQEQIIEEITVTAQKREQNVRDIASTVNAISGSKLDEMSFTDFREIEQLTAGLSLTTFNARTQNISLRGITTDPEANSMPGVDIYFNEVLIRSDVAFSQMFDMQRIEVLRGPQGTLQGRASPAGAIHLHSVLPDMNEVEGFIQGMIVDNDGINSQFGIGIPLIQDQLAIRMSGVYDESDGADITNITTGNVQGNETSAGRISLVWGAPGDNFRAKLVTQYLDKFFNDAKPLETIIPFPFPDPTKPVLSASDRAALAETDDFTDLNFSLNNLTLEWKLEGHTLTSVTGNTDYDKFSRQDNDPVNFVSGYKTFQNSHTVQDAFSQEIRFASEGRDKWNYMIGAYYLDSKTTTGFTRWIPIPEGSENLDVDFVGTIGIEVSAFTLVPVDTELTSLFMHNIFNLSDQLTLEAGLRWREVKRFNRADTSLGELGNVFSTYTGPGSDVNTFNNIVVPAVVAGTLASFETLFDVASVSDANAHLKSDALTGSIYVRYELNDNQNVYASYNRGFRPGLVSISPTPIPESFILYDDENSDAIEFGFKGRFLDGRATLNTALFYQQFDGYIGRVTDLTADFSDFGGTVDDVSGGITFNGDATIQGLEVEGQLLIGENWDLGGSMAYTDASWSSGAQAPCNVREPGEIVGLCEINGDRIAGEPEFSISLYTQYTIVLDTMEWYLRGLYKFKGGIVATAATTTPGFTRETSGYGVTNLYAGVRSYDGIWDISLWGKNMFDKEARTDLTNPGDNYDPGLYGEVKIIQGRTIGATARYNF